MRLMHSVPTGGTCGASDLHFLWVDAFAQIGGKGKPAVESSILRAIYPRLVFIC